MNDKTILGRIHPEHSRGYKTEKYKEHLEEFIRLYDGIEKILPSESRKMLEEMIEEYNSSQGEVVIDAFVKGFELGMSLAVEGLCFGSE